MKKFLPSILLAAVLIVPLFFIACKKEEKLTLYDITVSFDEDNNTLTGSEAVTYYNDTETAISSLKFNLFPAAFRKDAKCRAVAVQDEYRAYPSGVSYGDIEIIKVKIAEDDADYKITGSDKNVLEIPLVEELFPQDSVTVTIDFTVTLAKVDHRLGVNEHTVNLGNFYPILCVYDEGAGFYECEYNPNGDPFYSSVSNYKLSISLPKEYVVASSGELASKKEDGKTATYNYTLKNARDFALVLSKEFKTESSSVKGIEVNYFYYKDEDAKSSLNYAVKSLETFIKLFGDYPYKTYSVVETPFLEGGMEYPCLVYISSGIDREAYGEVIAHETAHQWWYGIVGNNEIEYSFLDEGLAEYSTVLFYENNPEYELKRGTLMDICSKRYSSYVTVYDKLMGGANTTMIRPLKDFTSSYEYVNIAYCKGCIMFDTLRQTIGDDKFFAGLKNYYEENAFKLATPDSLMGAFERCGANSNGYFESFYNGKARI